MTDPRAAIPGVDTLLAACARDPRFEAVSAARRAEILRAVLAEARPRVAAGSWVGAVEDPAPYLDSALAELQRQARPSLRWVVNATGVVLHTNLGRAPLALGARAAMARVTEGYSNLEFDLEGGGRGSRYDHCAALIRECTGAEDGLVVNNCAAGLVLALAALARGRDVVVSRGELVEIGGGFRIPEVLAQAGAGMREVGATNRTRIGDYEAAVRSGGVAAILKVHRSNFRITGFTAEASLEELAALSREHGIPLIHDLGSGLLVEADQLGLPPEPTPRASVRAGAQLVIFSGDKLLGGPQAGLVAGDADLVARMRKTPLCRALRVDKGTLAGLEATLQLYRDPEVALSTIPVLRMLRETPDSLKPRGEALRDALRAALAEDVSVELVPGEGRVGGGTYPEHPLPSLLLRIRGSIPAEKLARTLRAGTLPVVARVEDDAVLLDLRTILPEEDLMVKEMLAQAYTEGG